jgi:hypothetical protein
MERDTQLPFSYCRKCLSVEGEHPRNIIVYLYALGLLGVIYINKATNSAQHQFLNMGLKYLNKGYKIFERIDERKLKMVYEKSYCQAYEFLNNHKLYSMHCSSITRILADDNDKEFFTLIFMEVKVNLQMSDYANALKALLLCFKVHLRSCFSNRRG